MEKRLSLKNCNSIGKEYSELKTYKIAHIHWFTSKALTWQIFLVFLKGALSSQ